MILVMIGPMGCGKTTVGRLIAERLGFPFEDADDFHPPENVSKMRNGIPLDDEDRIDWLATLKGRIDDRRSSGENLVLACSALKTRYRDLLGVDQKEIITIYLKGSRGLLRERLNNREHQYMNKELLDSQVDAMEAPTDGLIVDISRSPDALCDEIVSLLKDFQGKKSIGKQTQIGIAGLAVMGENLALNIAEKGISVAVYNRTTAKVEKFLSGRAKSIPIIGFHDIANFVESLTKPRKIMMMLKAGEVVDNFIELLLPHLSKGDIVIDGGNANYHDTIRRSQALEAKGLLFIGVGVSGGEEGALRGPSIMSGGSREAWPHLEPIFSAISAKVGDGESCCGWMGRDGAGHFVKMVHNGIEYGDMQLICDSYHLMKTLLSLGPEEMHRVYSRWNKGDLSSYLIEITSDIFAYREPDGSATIDQILDAAGQKGTGKWTVISALDMGTPLSLISESVFARCISAAKETRVRASSILTGPKPSLANNNAQLVDTLERAVYCAKIISYTQGFALLNSASDEYGWDLDYALIARVWRGGCIIRSVFLDRIADSFEQEPRLENLLFAPYFSERVNRSQADLRNIVSLAASHGIPVPSLSAALGYFDSLRSARLPANLLQAQRDYFGAHTYERADKPRGEFFHTNWTGKGGDTTSTAYVK
jgi:6-phosphogluconate dehydrogenase